MTPRTPSFNNKYSVTSAQAKILPRARILYFDHTSNMSGGEIALLNLLTELDHSRFSPVVVLCREGPLLERLNTAGIETRLLLLNETVLDTRKDSLSFSTLLRVREVLATLLYTAKLAFLIKNENADIVHTNSLKADVIGGVAARLVGVPVVWHVRDRITAEYLSKNVVELFRIAGKIIPNFVIANSHSTLATMNLGKPDKTAAIYSGIKYERRDSRSVEESGVVHDGVPPDGVPPGGLIHSLKKEFALLANPSVNIGLIGRLSSWKGQHIFIRAAEQVIKQFPFARFKVIGSALFDEADYEKEIRTLRTELDLEDIVEFVGFRSDIVEAISELDVVVHASTIGEPFGQVIVEGMASGKPVVATNGGGVPEIIEDDVNGLLVPMGDAAAMADAICWILANPSQASEMAKRGRARVEQCFLIEQTARKVEAVYDTLLKAKTH